MTAAAGRARSSPGRLGIFGGTFDPPHFGHLALAEWARVALRLDRIFFVPAGLPPHKERAKRSATRHRVAMTRLAIRGNAAFAVSTLESGRRGPSYTADTVRAVASAHPGARLHLLMGADTFATFASWREPEAIAERCVLVVARRPGSEPPRRSPWSRRGRGLVWLENPGLDVSSTKLREWLRAGRSLRYLTPDPVARYAALHGLYGLPGAGRRRRSGERE